MEKITLNGKEYELGKLTFKSFYELGEMGFDCVDVYQIQTKPSKFLGTVVAYVTKTSIPEACEIIDKTVSLGENTAADLLTKLAKWVTESDFFKEQQAKKK